MPLLKKRGGGVRLCPNVSEPAKILEHFWRNLSCWDPIKEFYIWAKCPMGVPKVFEHFERKLPCWFLLLEHLRLSKKVLNIGTVFQGPRYFQRPQILGVTLFCCIYTQKCSSTAQNTGGWGFQPIWSMSISRLFFLRNGFPKCIERSNICDSSSRSDNSNFNTKYLVVPFMHHIHRMNEGQT